MEQVFDQAGRETLVKIQDALRKANIGVRFVEEPEVTAVYATGNKSK